VPCAPKKCGTRHEILRGLKVKQAAQQIAALETRCRQSSVLPLTDEIIDLAAAIYADLYTKGQLISDADILAGATGLIHRLTVVTENPAHFSRIPGLRVESRRTA
jgi:tRNA(fMet)-specific endonuclease VapC